MMNDCQLPFMVKYLVAGSHDLRSGSFLHGLKEMLGEYLK